MRPRTRAKLYLGLSIAWALLLVQAASHLAAGDDVSVPGVLFGVAVEVGLIAMTFRAWGTARAAERPSDSRDPERL